MAKTKLGLDIGYSQTKVSYNGKLYKFPTAISFAIDSGISYGEDDFYIFEGKKYRVGDIAIEESFVTTDYSFLERFAPLILFHILNKLGLIKDNKLIVDLELRTGLALIDWNNKEKFVERFKKFEVNGININIQDVKIIPQGAGVYYDYKFNKLNGADISNASVIDIGYNTINFLYFENDIPIKPKSKAFPSHGIVSIIRPFTNWLENTYKMNFTEQEAIKILLNKKFIFNGQEQPEVLKMIQENKANFITKLFNSILVSEKKILSTSEKVIIAGGGAYLLEDVKLPPNVDFPNRPLEFANVRGYMV